MTDLLGTALSEDKLCQNRIYRLAEFKADYFKRIEDKDLRQAVRLAPQDRSLT